MSTSPPLNLSQIFAAGLTISLEVEDAGVPQFLLSRVEEAHSDRLWVTMPVRSATFLPLPIESAVVVHVKHDDAGYTLYARVNGRRLQPTPMLELLPSGEIQRRQPRLNSRLRMTLIPTSAVRRGWRPPSSTSARVGSFCAPASTLPSVSGCG
jgi:hypothetical protein